jgi:hypothetical protein
MVTVPPIDVLKVFKTSEESMLARKRIMLHGPPGSGKTFCALTASSKWPIDIEKGAVLDDLAFFSFDNGALDGLVEYPITLPNVLDLNAWMEETGKNILEALNLIVAVAREFTKIPGRVLVVDTVSSMDKIIVQFAEAKDFRSKNGEPDPFAMYRYIMGVHRKLYSELAKMNADIIFCCHSKGLSSEKDDSRSRAGKLAGIYDIQPNITGQSLDIYTANVSMEAAILASIDPGTKKIKRWLYPNGGQGFRGKNRWQRYVMDKEEPNLNKLFTKITKGK